MGSTVPPNWTEIKSHLDQKYYIHANDATKNFMWVIVAIYPVTIILHILGAIKRGQQTGFWLVRRDSEGYIVENRHVLIHALSAVKTTLACLAVILLQHDIRTHIHHYCVAVQASGFVVMHIHNWHRSQSPRLSVRHGDEMIILLKLVGVCPICLAWASIYSMPPTSLYMNLNQAPGRSASHQTDRILPPWLFNFGLVGGSLYGVILTAAAATIISASINRENALYGMVSAMLEENISLAQNPTPESQILMMKNALAVLSGVGNMKEESDRIFRAFQFLVCGFVAINIISVGLFWWSLNAIVRCLNGQLHTYRRCLQNRDEVIQLGMVSVCPEPPDYNTTKSAPSPPMKTTESNREANAWSCAVSQAGSWIGSFHRSTWKSWFPSLKSDDIVVDHLIWRSALMRSIKREGTSLNSRLRSDYAILQRCKTNTLWQAVFITLMSWAYTSMAITLGANAFDVPTRTSISQLGFYVILWSNTIWVIGGTAVAALSARVAFSGSYTSTNRKIASDVECQGTKSFDY